MSSGAENKNHIFWIGLVLCTVYQSYRYPLQINTVGFSPNYSDTPIAWQLGKFLLACPLVIVSALRWLGRSGRVSRWPVAIVALFLSCYSLLKVLVHPDSEYIDICFWILFSLVLVLGVDRVRVSQINRYFLFLLIYSLASDLIQVVLYLGFGRLPAMAGSFVRFGSFLDDPNGFAPITFLLMGWCYYKYVGRKRLLLLAALFACLVLTQSWTALAFFALAAFLFVLISATKRPLLALFLVCVVPWLVAMVVQWFQRVPWALLADALEAKQGSIEGHFFPWDQWAPRFADWAFLGDWQYNPYECWWAAAMVNFGVIWLALYFGLVACLLFYTWRSWVRSPRHAKPVYAGLLFFGVFFAVGSLGLPFPIKFPVNAIFFVFFFLAALGKISVEQSHTASMGASLPLAKATSESSGL